MMIEIYRSYEQENIKRQ